MAQPIFVDFNPPVVDASFLNSIATAAWVAIGDGSNPPTTPTQVRTNISAAKSGANSDITSMSVVTQLSTAAGVAVRGTNTNDNAAAGFVGEVISSTIASGAAVSLTSTVTANITSISLTAGDWDVSGYVQFTSAATTSITLLAGGVSITSATIATDSFRIPTAAFVPGAGNIRNTIPTTRVSLAATTTYYLVASATFTVDTLAASGSILARRAR